MNIGIAKIGVPIYLADSSEETASWSQEIVCIKNILEVYGHSIYFLTPHHPRDASREDVLQRYDRIYIFAGQGPLSAYECFKNRTDDLRLIITDLRFQPDNFAIFDKVYSQSPELGIYLPPTWVYFNFKENEIDLTHKTIDFYFGGGMRNRREDFLEYVYRPDHLLKVKLMFENEIIDNRVSREKHLSLLDISRFSIVIADTSYNDIGFITMRPFENAMHDVISFFDDKYDKYEKIIPHHSFVRVKNYTEMREKMKLLKAKPDVMMKILRTQRESIKQEYIDGSHTYGIIA